MRVVKRYISINYGADECIKSTSRWQFDNVLAFGAKNLIPTEPVKFILDFILATVIHGSSSQQIMPLLLQSAQTLAVDSSIIHIVNNGFTEYRWTHPTKRPHGHPVPAQCSRCHRLRSFTISTKGSKVILCCVKECGFRLTLGPVPGYAPIHSERPGSWVSGEI